MKYEVEILRKECLGMYDLKDVQMFSKLSDKHLSEVRANSVERSFSKDSIVFYEGDKGEYFYVLLEGAIKLYKTSPKGTQIEINRLEAPAIVGEYACFERMPFPATCEFIEDGRMVMIPYKYIYKYLEDPDFSLEMIKSLTSKIMVLSALVHKETIYSSEAKVAKILLENSEIFRKLKYNEIASILNLTPETLSRILNKLKKEHIIEADGSHGLNILDPDALVMTIESNKVKKCTDCISDFKSKMGL